MGEAGITQRSVAVVGAGPGGYAAAFRAADLGLKVTLIDPEQAPGGVCLHRGCIPSKAYLHAARLLDEANEASAWGLHFGAPRIDIDRLRAWKQEVVGELVGGLAALGRARGVDSVRGRAVLRGPNTLEIQPVAASRYEAHFDFIVLATGSRPILHPPLDAGWPTILTSSQALDLPEIPETLLVVGGGYIGCELATVYAALGSKVSLVEMTEELLPGADRDLVKPMAKRLEARLESVHLGRRVEGIAEQKIGIEVEFCDQDGTRSKATFPCILVATGRRPNTSGLGLETTAVTLDSRGFVATDSSMRCAEPSIFAIGDIAGDPMLAHKATHQGIVAAETIAGHKVAFEPNVIPAVVFTDPEIAWCGLSEKEATKQGFKVAVGRFPWTASGRAKTLGRGDGLTKIVAEADSGLILGVGIVGAGAGELIGEAVVAIEMGAVASDLAATIHAHPTLSETIMEAAEAVFGTPLHVAGRRKKAKT